MRTATASPRSATPRRGRVAIEVGRNMLVAANVETARHSDDVVVISRAICDLLEIKGAERQDLLAAARLHDIGKVAVPEEMLEKAGTLTDGGVGADARPTPRSASRSSARSRSSRASPAWCATRTSAGTAAATRTASPARRSRSAAGSSSARTPSTRSAPTVPTGPVARRQLRARRAQSQRGHPVRPERRRGPRGGRPRASHRSAVAAAFAAPAASSALLLVLAPRRRRLGDRALRACSGDRAQAAAPPSLRHSRPRCEPSPTAPACSRLGSPAARQATRTRPALSIVGRGHGGANPGAVRRRAAAGNDQRRSRARWPERR